MPPARHYGVWIDCLSGRGPPALGAGTSQKPCGERENAAGDFGEHPSGSRPAVLPIVGGNELKTRKE